jgi:hypothetical protein
MGEHRTNPTSLMAATLPPMVPPGDRMGVQIVPTVAPLPNILVIPEEMIRAYPDGRREILLATKHKNGEPDEKVWGPLPEPYTEVWPLGKMLPPEKCLLTFNVLSVYEERETVVQMGSRLPGRKVPQQMGNCGQINLAEWQAGNRRPADG